MHKRYRTSTKRLQAKLRRIIHDRLRNYATFKYGKLISFFLKMSLACKWIYRSEIFL